MLNITKWFKHTMLASIVCIVPITSLAAASFLATDKPFIIIEDEHDRAEAWGRDCGIDLVAEDIDGNNWAIQAKCYDPKYSVTKKDIDSFLSESTNTNIHRRLLITTSGGLGPNASGVIERQYETTSINQ